MSPALVCCLWMSEEQLFIIKIRLRDWGVGKKYQCLLVALIFLLPSTTFLGKVREKYLNCYIDMLVFGSLRSFMNR
jgi:hypothetical protein